VRSVARTFVSGARAAIAGAKGRVSGARTMVLKAEVALPSAAEFRDCGYMHTH
jgi:hypothetical protein